MRIGLTGAGGTGKGTLGSLIAEHLKIPFIPSHIKDTGIVMGLEKSYKDVNDEAMQLAFQWTIMMGQIYQERSLQIAKLDYVAERTTLDYIPYFLSRNLDDPKYLQTAREWAVAPFFPPPRSRYLFPHFRKKEKETYMHTQQPFSPSMSGMIPIVVEEQGNASRSFDIFSMLMRQRIIFLNTEVNSHIAGIITAQLLYLEAENPKADITMYINSPGGSISAGMGIYDTMNYIKPDVSTVCTGLAASMGSFLLAAGAKGKRFALPNAEIMIHQPLGGYQGQCSDIQIHARHIQLLKDKLNNLYVGMTGQNLETIRQDTDRDNWLTAEAAKEYGLIDEVIHNR